MPSHRVRPLIRNGHLVVVLSLACLAALPARANDRPFQQGRTAVVEDDDEQTWSFESWVQRYGSVRGLSFEPEYSFTPFTSVQFELSRFVDRAGIETGHDGEIEFKHLFNDIARDGYGWGVSGTFNAERANDEGTVRTFEFKVPVSISLWEGEGYLHFNAGVTKASDARRTFAVSAAIEREVYNHTLLFAEVARDGGSKFGQVGVRYWLKREKLAIDFSLQQYRDDGQRSSGFIIGFGWYDL